MPFAARRHRRHIAKVDGVRMLSLGPFHRKFRRLSLRRLLRLRRREAGGQGNHYSDEAQHRSRSFSGNHPDNLTLQDLSLPTQPTNTQRSRACYEFHEALLQKKISDTYEGGPVVDEQFTTRASRCDKIKLVLRLQKNEQEKDY